MFALDILNQYQSTNGTLLAAGKLYIYKLGRTELATVYGDHNGEHTIANPVRLDDQGMAEIYLNNAFDYTVVACDAYGAEQFSRDIFPRRMGDGESIGTQLYDGIDPIVVNNDLYTISANTSRLGVTEPLYFVRDDEEETIIGMSAIAVPSGTMNESAFSYQDDKITAYNGSAFSAGNEYEAGNYVSIDNNIISVTGLQPSGDYQSAGNYVSASELENLQPKGDYYSASNPSGFLVNEDITGKLDTTAFSTVSGDFLTAVPSEYVTENTLQSGLSSKLDSTAFSTVSGDFLTAHQSLDGYATEQWVEEKGYITGIDIPQSANWNNATTVVNNNSAIWNSTTNTVSSNSASWGASNPQIPITGINGIKISESGDKVVFEVSGDYATEDWVTGQGYLTAETDWTNTITGASAYAYEQATAAIPAPFDPTYISGQIDNKLDSAIYAAASGNFLTALPQDLVYTADIADMATTGDINDLVTSIAETYQSTAGMTAYQSAGDYYSASNPSGFITGVDLTPYQLTADMTAYQSAGDYYSASNPSGFITGVPAGTMNESAFEYDASNNITAYNGSALAGGLTGDYVSGVNWVSAQQSIGIGPPQTVYYEATISGDVKVTTSAAGAFTAFTHSLSDIGLIVKNRSAVWNEVSNKLDTTAFSTVSGDFYTTANESGFITGITYTTGSI